MTENEPHDQGTHLPGESDAIIIKTPEEVLRAEEAHRRGREDLHKRLQIWFNGLLTLFTIFLFLASVASNAVLIYQSRLLRDYVKSSQESAAAA